MTDAGMSEGEYISINDEVAQVEMVGEKYKRRKPRFTYSDRAKEKSHHPKTDDEAKALIERLGTYVWETHKVSGRFVANPYSLTATIDGREHTIILPGRFGTVLKWLETHTR